VQLLIILKGSEMEFKNSTIKEIIGLGINNINQVSREEALIYLAKIREALDNHHHFQYLYKSYIKSVLGSEKNDIYLKQMEWAKDDVELLMSKTYLKEE